MQGNKDEATSSQPLPSPPPSRPETFWSSCNGCGMQYEYLKMYLNQNLFCPNCSLPFLATEKPAPSSGKIRRTPGPWSVLQQQQQGMFAGSGGSGSATFTPSRATPTEPLIPSAGESLKDGMKTVAMAQSEKALQRNSIMPDKTDFPSVSEKAIKKRRKYGQKSKSTKDRDQMTGGSRATRTISSGNPKGNLGAERVNSTNDKSTSRKEFSKSELRTLLMGRAKAEILEKLNQWGIGAELNGAK
ncbi:Hypothetical predicted protein [Olea europaea subsp. europaea]|uniref:Zinc beta-ribbon domain-containing protein n=1 Tax=Olea europaea subsp. europaea TaxID=158383 RepID=A0A8S0PWB3_OLEEU|nr:Hypothetical predicted protein [Olea europaea subsp. europaea]